MIKWNAAVLTKVKGQGWDPFYKIIGHIWVHAVVSAPFSLMHQFYNMCSDIGHIHTILFIGHSWQIYHTRWAWKLDTAGNELFVLWITSNTVLMFSDIGHIHTVCFTYIGHSWQIIYPGEPYTPRNCLWKLDTAGI